MRTLRTFIGVPVGEEVVRAAAELSVALRRRLTADGRRGRWVPPQNLHVTLRFLGDVSEGRLPAVREALGPVVARHHTFLTAFRGLGVFPDPAHPSVLWIGLSDGAEGMTNLAVDVGRTLEALGFPEEARPFHPHLTLARFRREDAFDLGPLLEEHAGLELGRGVVREAVLFQSSLRAKGPVYTPIWRASLHAGGRISQKPEPPPSGDGDPAP